jgi:hypothetical protein
VRIKLVAMDDNDDNNDDDNDSETTQWFEKDHSRHGMVLKQSLFDQ